MRRQSAVKMRSESGTAKWIASESANVASEDTAAVVEATVAVTVIGTAMTAIETMTVRTTAVHLLQDTLGPHRLEDAMHLVAPTATCHRIAVAVTTTPNAAVVLPHTVDLQSGHGRHPDGVNAATPAQTFPARHLRGQIGWTAMITTNPLVQMTVNNAHNHLGRIAEDPQTTAASVVDPHRARVRHLAETDVAPRAPCARAHHRTKADTHHTQTTSCPAPSEDRTHTVCRRPAGTILLPTTAAVDVPQTRSRLMVVLTRWVMTTNFHFCTR